MVQEFTLENLPNLNDGLIAAAFNQMIERCAADCDDRPHHAKPREITLKVTLKPIPANKDLDTVQGACVVSCNLPKIELPPVSFGFRKKKGADGRKMGTLVFNDMSEENIKQRTIDE